MAVGVPRITTGHAVGLGAGGTELAFMRLHLNRVDDTREREGGDGVESGQEGKKTQSKHTGERGEEEKVVWDDLGNTHILWFPPRAKFRPRHFPVPWFILSHISES